MRIEWHPEAVGELKKLGTAEQRRIKKVLDVLLKFDDPRQNLVPYSANMKGFWKLRVGDFRLVCQLQETNGVWVLERFIVKWKQFCRSRFSSGSR